MEAIVAMVVVIVAPVPLRVAAGTVVAAVVLRVAGATAADTPLRAAVVGIQLLRAMVAEAAVDSTLAVMVDPIADDKRRI